MYRVMNKHLRNLDNGGYQMVVNTNFSLLRCFNTIKWQILCVWAMMQFLRCEDGCHLPGQILWADQAVPPRDCGQWRRLPVAPHLPAGGGQDARTQETLRTHQTALQGLYMCHVNLLYVNHRKRVLRNLSYPDHVIHLPAPGWWLAAWSITPQRRTVSATRPGHTPALPPSPSPRSQPSWVLILGDLPCHYCD